MGGSGGHMRHPHDLDEVKTGEDIIALFRAIPAYLRSEEFKSGQTTSLKLDGSNNAIKVIGEGFDDLQFAVDRGGKGTSTLTQIDVIGVTADRLQDRFPKNPGLAASSAGLINMMTSAFQKNQEAVFGLLQQLGLIDEKGAPDPTKFINIEYIDRVPEDIDPKTKKGRANAIYYTFDSITFLNISQYYEVVTMVSQKDPATGKSLKAPNGRVLRDLKRTRPGLERPIIKTLNDAGEEVEKVSGDTSVAIDFDKAALDKIAELAQPYAPKSKSGQQFQVLGPGDLGIRIDHNSPEDSTEEEIDAATERTIQRLDQDIENTLNSELTFAISDQTSITKSLREWLQMTINFPYKPDIQVYLKDAAGNYVLDDTGNRKTKSAGPFTKDLHERLVINREPLSEVMPFDPDLCKFDKGGTLYDCEKAIYGAIFYEAARRLGNTTQRALAAKVDKFGDAVDHEGVVINAGMPFGDKRTSNTFKLTGEFIVSGKEGVYAQMLREDIEDIEIENEDDDPVIDVEFEEEPFWGPEEPEEDVPETIAIVPGAYKPPHKGHLDMIIKYLTGEGLSVPKADKVIVIISRPTKKGRYLPDGTEVGVKESIALWEQLLGGMPGVEVVPSETHASPINAGYEMVGPDTRIPAGTNIILGASKKEGDWKRWAGAHKYISDALNLIDPEASAVPPKEHDDGYIEALLKDENRELYNGLPSVKSAKNPNEYHASDFRYMIGEAATNSVAKRLLESFIGEGNVKALFTTFGLPSDLDEISGMAMGSAALGVGTTRSADRRKSKKVKKKKKQRESNNLNLIDDVMRLIMERGIMR